ncbi:MAG TPA: hypothetical protein VMZ50_14440 [Phycisphaerae bacterium]|nr:hypothetical protein [Phycisphaerae bacterium]
MRLAPTAICALLSIMATAKAPAEPPKEPDSPDSRLAAAKRFVEKSDRYMHHSRLRRGMKGYGLTVFAGTKIERFGVEVISVVTRWGPHQDVILARCSGQNLEKTGIISGMSGSPVFVKDPDDGKDKMIGALAYGWKFQKEPVCGIQPITQMLAVRGFLPELDPPPAKTAADPKRAASQPTGQAAPAYLRTVLDPKKADFAQFGLPARRGPAADQSAAAGPQLVPLTTPLMVSSTRSRTLDRIARMLRPMGLVPMQSGGVGGAEAGAARDARLVPGASVSIPLVTGDADWTAIGTVTEAVDGKVLALGHAFFGEGDLALPMGPGYIHTVVSSQVSSFKLGSTLRLTGALQRDEFVGVAGRIGPKVPMIPLKVTVHWKNDARTQTLRYNVARHSWLTLLLADYLIHDAALGWRDVPEYHTVRHEVAVDFGKLGTYRAANVLSAGSVSGAASDALRPIAAMQSNPFGPAVAPERIEVNVTIESGDVSARILDLKLEGDTYRPGETVRGAVTIRPFRKPRRKLPVRLELPEDLPEGEYVLTVCDAEQSMRALLREMPHRFDPRSVAELFRALQRVVQPRSDHLYLRLPLPRGGVAVGQRELPDLPDSRARILSEARRIDAKPFSRSLVRSVETKYALTGAAAASFTVRAKPAGTLIRKQGE